MDRIIRNRKFQDFTQIDNSIFRAGLSLKAIGLFTYILHFPPDWIIYKKNLIKDLPQDGRTSFNAAWDELVTAGYITSKKVYCVEKKRPEWEYEVFETPCSSRNAENQHYGISVENQQKGDELTEREKPVSRTSENQPLTNTILNTNTITSNINLSNDKSILDVPTNQPDQGKPAKEPKKRKTPAKNGNTPGAENEAHPAPEMTVYQQFIDKYYKWVEKTIGITAKIDGIQGKSAKAIIAYLRSEYKKKASEHGELLTEQQEDEKIIKGWAVVLDNYHLWDSWHQQKTRLMDINTNFQNILKNVKDGLNNSGQSQQTNNRRKGEKLGRSGALSAINIVNERLNNAGGRTSS